MKVHALPDRLKSPNERMISKRLSDLLRLLLWSDVRSSKTPLSFDDDTNEILSHSLSLCRLSQNVFWIKRVFQTLSDDVNTKRLSLALSWKNTFSFAFVLETRFKKCLSTRENFRAFNNDDLLFFLGQKQPVWVEKDARNSRAFAFKSQKRSVYEWMVWSLSLSLSLSGKRARRNARKNTRV